MKSPRNTPRRRLPVLAACLLASSLSLTAHADEPAAAAPPAASSVPAAPAPTTPAPAPTTVAAATPAPQVTPAPAASTAKPKLVCEDDSQIGSHLRHRLCMSPEQAEARKKAARDYMDSHHNSVSCGDAGCAGATGGPPR